MLCTLATLLLRVCVCACLFFCSGVLHAHTAHNKEIHRLDHLVQQADSTSPDVFPLLLRRADLHRRDANWNAALDDYQTIATIQPDNPGMLLGITQLYLDQESFLAASQWSGKLLKKHSNHIQALMMHARAHAGLGNLSIVTGLYGRAIDLMEHPKPEHYLEYAGAVLQSGSESSAAQAIAIVDAGAMKLNHPVSLHSFALEQELQSEQFEAAVMRIERVVAINPRLWPWHLKKVELLVSLRRVNEACFALKMLENDMQKLPPQRNNTPAMRSIWSAVDELQSECASQ